jgi:hypothetical protein
MYKIQHRKLKTGQDESLKIDDTKQSKSKKKKTFTSTWGDLRVFGGICGGHLFNVLCYALFFFGFY